MMCVRGLRSGANMLSSEMKILHFSHADLLNMKERQ